MVYLTRTRRILYLHAKQPISFESKWSDRWWAESPRLPDIKTPLKNENNTEINVTTEQALGGPLQQYITCQGKKQNNRRVFIHWLNPEQSFIMASAFSWTDAAPGKTNTKTH